LPALNDSTSGFEFEAKMSEPNLSLKSTFLDGDEKSSCAYTDPLLSSIFKMLEMEDES